MENLGKETIEEISELILEDFVMKKESLHA